MSIVFVLLILLVGLAFGLPAPSEIKPRAYAVNSGSYGEAGASAVNIPVNNGNSDLFYVKVKGPTALDSSIHRLVPWKSEIGVLDVSARDKVTSSRASTKFLTAGLEGGHGLMGRASLTEGTVGIGPVDLNMGIGVDTGFIVDRGIEAKYLGIGGKIGADGIQACFILCFGISW